MFSGSAPLTFASDSPDSQAPASHSYPGSCEGGDGEGALAEGLSHHPSLPSENKASFSPREISYGKPQS